MSRRGPVEEEDGYVDVVHVTDEDVSDTVELRVLTPEQRRAIDLLELNPDRRPRVRLTRAQWRHVDRVVTALGALGVPPPRRPANDIETEGERL